MAADIRVGPYRILRLISRGGQGSVYLGYDKRLHRKVAIKICALPKQRADRKRLLHEARMVASIQSTKVVQIHDVIESGEHLALVMEYVAGCDLEEFLATTQPSLASVLTIGADIAGALAAARQQHIVHGDLKAGNVLISGSGRVKLTDFGIARSAAWQPPPGFAGGSLSALSPEQYLGKPLDVRSDLFALGCLLYRMLTGEQAFFRGGQLDAELLLGGSPRPMRELVTSDRVLPEDLVNLVTDLLQSDPQKRPDNTHRVRQVLRKVSREIPLAASNSLLQQARPCFRQESVDDIPPLIPADLGREARSRLAEEGAGIAWLRHRFALLGWPARTAGALALTVLSGALFVMAMGTGETLVRIDEPLLRVAADTDLPVEISGRWLVEEVKYAMSAGLGAIRVSGPVGTTHSNILYARPAEEAAQLEPQEALQVELRCAQGLCVFAVAREYAGKRRNQQAVLFPDMALGQWREIVRSTTLALYE